MIHIKNETGEREVTPTEFIDLVAAGQVREDDWICGETLTDDQWVRAGDHSFFRRYAPANPEPIAFDVEPQPSTFSTQREQALHFIDTLFRTPHVTLALTAAIALIWIVMSAMSALPTLQALVQGGVARQPFTFLSQVASSFLHGTENALILIRFGAKDNGSIQAGEYWRLLTCMFLHIGWLHLLMNGYALFSFGRFAENIYGKRRFLVIYFLSGLGGSLASYWFSVGKLSAGASGAIFGLLGVMLVFNVRYYRSIPHGLRRSLLINLVFILVLNLALGLMIQGVDNFGHMGGLLTGALLGLLLKTEILETSRPQRASLMVNTMVAGIALSLVYAVYGVGQSIARPLQRQAIVLNDPQMHLLTGMRWLQIKRYDRAAEEFRQVLRSLPNNPDVNLLLADALAGTGDTSAAITHYKRALALNPNTQILHQASNNLAYLYADKVGSHLDEALRLSQTSLRLSPNNPVYLDTLGWIYYKQNQLEQAETALKKAVNLAPREAELIYHLGAVYEAQGKDEDARAAYQQTLTLDSLHTKAREALEGMRRKTAT